MMETKLKYKMTELGEIPAEWKVYPLKEIVLKIGDGNYSSKYPKKDDFIDFGIPFLRANNLKKGKLSMKDMRYISLEQHNTLKKGHIKVNDIIITVRGQIGNVAITTKEFDDVNMNAQLAFLRFNDQISSKFILYFFQTTVIQNWLFSITTGTALQQLPINRLKNINIIIPALKEQQKIAKIISTVDEQIEQTDQLIEKTKELKKGLMQELLTKGIGHNKFKQSKLGEIPDSWIIEKLEKTSIILDSKRKPIKKNDRIAGSIPYYGATGIIDWVNDYLFDESLILVGEDGENLNSRVLPMAFKVSGKTWINNHAHVLKPLENINIDYLTYFLESVNYSNYITGSAQPKLNQEQLRKLLIIVPLFQEQQKIAEILSTVDKEIEGYRQEKFQYEELKKGLMQQLLTGKTRVKVD